MDQGGAHRAAADGGRDGGAARLSRRILVGAFGDPGHAFPAIALAAALRARGHEVWLETWRRWEEGSRGLDLRFAAAPEYPVFPTTEQPLSPYEAVARAAVTTRELVREVRPDVVVHDILTLAPALAAELEGVPAATLIPHLDPRGDPGRPPFSIGARLPRTAAGRAMWKATDGLVAKGLELGRRELNATRERLGLPPLARVHGGISEALCLVSTFPQLEYPRSVPVPSTHVVGPLAWEPPSAGEATLPGGEGPLVLVAPSTSQDPKRRLLRAALEGLADLPVRVLAVHDDRHGDAPPPAPANATLVPWLPYARVMPSCDVVVCHGGHGTVARALGAGCVPVLFPAAGDMNETAARVDWAGCGVRVPRRWTTPRGVRLGVLRALSQPDLRRRAAALAAWSASHDAGARASELVEALAAAGPAARGAPRPPGHPG